MRHFGGVHLFCLWVAGTMLIPLAVVGQPAPSDWNALLDEIAGKAIVRDPAQPGSPALLEVPDSMLQGIERIIVVPLDNDPGRALTDRIKIALTRSRFTVVERDDIDKILNQFKWNEQQEGLVSEETVKEMGHFLGVDALLYGRVEEAVASGDSPWIGLTLKLVNVETTRLLWGKTCQVQRAPLPPKPGFFGPRDVMILGIVIVLIGLWLATRPKARPRLAGDRSVRQLSANDLREAIRSLRDASDRLGSSGNNQALFQKVKDCIDQLDRLSRQVENAPYGSGVKPETAGEVVKFDQSFASLLSEPKELAARLREAAGAADQSQTNRIADDLSRRITELENQFSRRARVMNGV